jgi:uncharacterized protein (TIGR03437 family)
MAFALLLCALPFAPSFDETHAQQRVQRRFKLDTRRPLATRPKDSNFNARKGGYVPLRSKRTLPTRPSSTATPNANDRNNEPVPTDANGVSDANQSNHTRRRPSPARIGVRSKIDSSVDENNAVNVSALPLIRPGTPLSRILHTSQLSNISSDGSHEQYVDQNGNLEADERTTFDALTGSYDIAVGRSGSRYEVFTAIDDRGTATPIDDIPFGVLVVALDTDGNYTRDASNTYDLDLDFSLPSAVSVVSGTSRAGREFVIVSSSSYYNAANPNDPNNEPSAGVVLLVRDPSTGGFDNTRSRELVRVGSNQLNNANALALLPNNDLLIADFDSNELRIVRDTNDDRIPDTLDPVPYYVYQFSNDAPLDIAANSRGVVFSHSYGNDAVLLAVYDDNGDGRADGDEVCVEGLSLDNNLILHGLTVDREGTVYVIEDASGAADTTSDGGNGGDPRIDAFPDPALNGILRDGSIFAFVDDPATQSLTGLAFGVDTTFGAVGRLALVNSASLRSPATRDGLATVTGTNLTLGASGATSADAAARGVRVRIEGRNAPVLSFSNTQIHIHVPDDVLLNANSVVVSVNGVVTAADDARIADANPGIFTVSQNGAGEAIALLVSGQRYTRSPFPTTTDGQRSVVALFGTGWRKSLPVNVSIGGRAASVEYAGRSGGFSGLDQINVRIPDGVSGAASVVVTTADGATSRNDVVITIQ